MNKKQKLSSFRAYFLKIQRFYKKAVKSKVSKIFHKLLLVFLFRNWTNSCKVMATAILAILDQIRGFVETLVNYERYRKTIRLNFVAFNLSQNFLLLHFCRKRSP